MRVDFIGGSLDGQTREIPESPPEIRIATLPELHFEELQSETTDLSEYVETKTEVYTDIGHGLFMMTRRT